jgi:hypothetical protein
MASNAASLQSGEGASGQSFNNGITLTGNPPGSSLLLQAEMLEGNGGQLPEAAASETDADIIWQLKKELNEKEEKIQHLTEMNDKLIELSSCVSRSARTNESELKKQIEKLKLQIQLRQGQLNNQEHRREVERMTGSEDEHHSLSSGPKRTGENMEIKAAASTAELESVRCTRSMNGSVVSHPAADQDDAAVVDLNFATRCVEEEEMEFSTAVDNEDEFEVIQKRSSTRCRQTENEKETTQKRQTVDQYTKTVCQQTQTVSSQTQVDVNLQRVTTQRGKELIEMVKQQEQTIYEKTKMIDNLRAHISSIKSEQLEVDQSQVSAEIVALKLQIFENEDAWRKEHNDRVMLNRRKEQLKRDCNVYKTERDVARRQAEEAKQEKERVAEEMMKLKDQLLRLQYASRGRTNSLHSTSNRTSRYQSSNVTSRGHYSSRTRHTASSPRNKISGHDSRALSGRGFTSSKNHHSAQQSYSSVTNASQLRLTSSERGTSRASQGNAEELWASQRNVIRRCSPGRDDVVLSTTHSETS